jgi:hypothetical protein
MSFKRSIRSSQLISPFGVGAVVDLAGESLVNMDITHWPVGECTPLKGNNLGRLLGKEIRRPPTEERRSAVPFTRFPKWLFCPSCRRLYHLTLTADKSQEFEPPICSEVQCNKTSLVPMRFVTVCSAGHLGDVDWYFWAHRNQQVSQSGQCAKQTSKLYFETTGASGGDFNSMFIRCVCGARNPFERLTEKNQQKCGGKQPWQKYDLAVNCLSEDVRVHPRSASNVYYPSILSSLDIADDLLKKDLQGEYAILNWLENYSSAISLREAVRIGGENFLENSGVKLLVQQISNEACRQFAVNQEAIQVLVRQFLTEANLVPLIQNTDEDTSQQGLLKTEWPYLSRSSGIQTKYLNTNPIQLDHKWSKDFSDIFEQVTIVNRLREVRALIGFKRLKSDKESKLVPVDLGAGESWLPGVELFGEGIFLKFREQTLSNWDSIIDQKLTSRIADLKAKCEQWGREPTNIHSSPRFIMLHTFAHGLIRRLAFDAGYSASSLRERVYCDKGVVPMAGVLIYTSESDSEGSLGGLARQGDPDRLLLTIKRTLIDLSWCSGDPVCSELESQGVDGMNTAACHACSLISETSCMYNNSLLDRRLITGSENNEIPGFMMNLNNKRP